MNPRIDELYRIALPKTTPMTACTDAEGRFWEKTPGNFAYVMNLLPQEDELLIEAGFLFPSDWDYVASIGERDTSIRLRVIRRVSTVETLHAALAEANALRDAWFDKSREEVKRHIAEKQKAFLQRITAQLKPLGFRKKAANWTFQRGDGYEVVWNAQKSAYSDGYYFNLYLHRVGMRELYGCIDKRPMGGLLDWQTVPGEEFDARLNTVIEERIRPLMTLPLTEIARQPDRFGRPYVCEPRRCADCWYPEKVNGN